ncbi:proteasome stabiliser-domain-containing protein [Aspergillus pseudocaelatus]|uniref:Proteasome stabiliser-domain-containing protein n=1 Tax=Aspergillus pseudocaelatus TaxID=1825620 RepID=A0ABQ6WCS3_9EURO|nr:proteasome stabiliser-domain-containing protein [Aspergillus pseudocaelatus]
MSQYNALWQTQQKLIFDLGNIINDIYTGPFGVTLTAYFSREGNARTADVILPISTQKSSSNSSSAFTVPGDNTKTLYRIPPNTSRAVVSVSACGQSTEEFWWSNLYGYSPFREVQLHVDDILAGIIWPFPVIFTGGVAPGFWRPVVGIDAFDLRQPEIDISPFLPILKDGRPHSFEIKIVGLNVSRNGTVTLSNSIGSYWVVTGNIFLYLSDSTLDSTSSGIEKPYIDAPNPQFKAMRSLAKNQTGGNDSLAYSVLGERTLSIRSSEFQWSQNLTYSNFGLFNQQGMSQSTNQHTAGRSTIIALGANQASNEVLFEYPLSVNQTYRSTDAGLSIHAWMSRGLDIKTTGVTGAVPDILITALGRRFPEDVDSDAPPNKRRKLTSGIQSLRELNGLSDTRVPRGYIPLARFHLYLDFASASPIQDDPVVPARDKLKRSLPASFQEFADVDGRVCFASQLFMIVTTDLVKWFDGGSHLRGGILAEEMGLGKTVEMISLICLNRRLLAPEETFPDHHHDGLRPSGATLIITPPAILEQWEQEIKLHAPGLNVFHYTGIQRHQSLSDEELIELLADQDVVLTTYNILAREVHYSGDVPQRNLRHKKRFEPRRTPLVRISWWRVCIDEAQMIESGVSNAARVARLIPRQNAWAVTGTPLRKDISDLLGLLLFLHYEPFCGAIWHRLCGSFRPELASIVCMIALRHSKDRVRNELHIPPQKRIVITVPFTAVEEQRYGQLFEEMCGACGLDLSGAPLNVDWDPDDPSVIERMRSWLIKLRRTCLHPAGKPLRGIGTGTGPLRSVAEVLEVMIDQNDALIHAEERSLLLSQLRRGQLLENAKHRQQALGLWTNSLERANAIVKECRDRLHSERMERPMSAAKPDLDVTSADTASEDENEEATKNTRVGARQRLRAALEVQHICVFFTGNAYFQIKTDPRLTEPDSEEFRTLEKREVEAYESAKLIRKEMLAEISRKVGHFMKTIRERAQKGLFVNIPQMKPRLWGKGLESRRVLDKFEDFCDSMNRHAVQYDEWRQTMIKFLSQSLIDQEDESELEGDEYEKSTKHQDEMYVYMEALRAMFADRHDALTGQKNVLIAHEVKSGIVQAQKGEGPSPSLFLQMMNTRSRIKPDPQLGSLRGIISELRSLATSLEWQTSGGNSRAHAELELVTLVLQNASQMASEQAKVAANMEKEVEMFRDTMNNRLEYYRQLQQISDTVAPYDEESAGKPLDEALFSVKLRQEEMIDEKISALRAKHRYLIHLRDESGSDDSAKICVICQSGFEVVCGHKYCKDCLRMWWHQHRTCPTCKKHLKANDFYQITYKPQEFLVQEEKPPTKVEPERRPKNLIYTDISSGTLKEIKTVDLDGSFGTKIDTLARHILWLRHHDPGAKSVIFSQYKDFLEVLAIAFHRFKIGFSSVDSKDGISKFKSDPSVECFFLHARAQSSGLNLVNATHVFLCEPLINTAIELQAIARVHRIGQHRPTTVWMYLVSDTVEESIYELSVSRRLAHIVQKEKAESLSEDVEKGRAVTNNISEAAIDSANSLEIRDAALSNLMAGGASGGELVRKDDLWRCLFGSPTKKDANNFQAGADGEVARFLRGSESLAVRNKVIAVCQHINNRVQAPSIKLPVAALLKQFKEQKSKLIRHFDLIYIQQGIDRLGANARVEILLPLLQGISEIGTSIDDQAAVVFNLALRLLPLLKLPPKDSTEDIQLKSRLGLSDKDAKFLSSWFEKLLIFFPADKNASTCPGLSPADYAFLNKSASPSETWNPSSHGGLNLTETKATALRFLGSSAFTDSERFFPALVASADPNSRLADLGEEILKRFIPALEDTDVVHRLFTLYFGSVEPDGATPARTALRIKILVYLGKSLRAASETANILRLIEEGLLSDVARSSQGLQASKLRTQIFTFTTWVVRIGSPTDLRQIAPKVIGGLRDFIHSQGWPSPGSSGQRLPATDLSLRGLAYESIGILVPKVDFQVQDEQNAISGFELIRWLFISLSSDDSSAQIFVSIEQALGSILNSSVDSWDKEFQESLQPFLLRQMNSLPGEEDPVTGFKIIRRTQYAAVRFANRFLPYSDVVARWIDLMAVACGSERHHEVVEEGKKGLHPYWYRLLNPTKDKIWFTSVTADSRSSWFKFPSFSEAARFLLGSTASTVVPGLSAAEILSGPYKEAFNYTIAFLRNILLWESLSSSNISTEIEQDWDIKLDVLLTSDEARCAVKHYIESSDKEAVLLFLTSALSGLSGGAQKGLWQCGENFIGICSLASNDIVELMVPKVVTLKNSLYSNDQELQNFAARALGILASHPAFSENQLRELLSEFLVPIGGWKSAIGEVVLITRGAVLALAYILSRLAFRNAIYKAPETTVNLFISTVFDIIRDARDSLLRRSAQVAIGQLSLSGVLSRTVLSDDEWETINDKLKPDAKAESEIAIIAMGLLSVSFSKVDHKDPQFTNFLNSLYDLHEIRSPETHFTVGEALSGAAAGWTSKSIATEFDVDEKLPTLQLSDTVLAEMCDKIITDCGASKPSLRKASSIWLLCLVKNCGHLQQMQARLRKCQRTFTRLLADRDEVVQETGAQGLSLVYDIGDQTLKDDLVRDLVDSFTAAGSNLGGGKVNEDTELFEPGALPTGGGSSVNTYKDIMNLASEAGDPTLVYRFMSLASNNALWTNRAAFSKLGISTIFSDSSANGYLAKNPKIYPKLFRYRFDPNPNVQRSMNTIWQALVKDTAAIISDHFDEIMDDLLRSLLAGREWRVRQARRQPEKYSKYMEEIFLKAFKLVDDIKESVRAAALKLCQAITNAVIRTLETSYTETKRADIMLASTIPFLLSDKGMESDVQEVQGFAIGALIQIIKKSPGQPLRPFVPRVMEQFLNSLSSLEPQAVNYVHLNADKYGLTGQEIDKMRLSSIRTSPMMEVIERMKEFAESLESVLRSAVGLPTKVGCSRVLVLLSMRTLLVKYVVDRNDTVSASYCTSIGYLMRLASDDRVLKTIEHAKTLYLTAEDANQRIIAAEILHSTSKLSNDRFMAFAATALPFIFVSKYDTDEHVQEAFEKTWQDNVGEITSLHTAALGFANGIMALDPELDLATSECLWPVLEKALAGKTWDGKEVVKLWLEKPRAGDTMKAIAIREAKRINPTYRPHAITAFGGIAQARQDLNLMPDAVDIVSRVLSEFDQGEDSMDIDSGSGQKNKQTREDTLVACVKCLLQCINLTCAAPVEATNNYVSDVKRLLHEALDNGGRNVQITLYEELRMFSSRVSTGVLESQDKGPKLRELQISLAALASEMLSRQIDVSAEAIRRERAQAAMSYITFCKQLDIGLDIDGELCGLLKTWRESERSGPVQQVLDQALARLMQ